MNNQQVLIMDEEYWSIEPAIDRIRSVFGEDAICYCADGGEGIRMLEHKKFGCIILDIMFPLGTDLETDEDTSNSINGGLIILKLIRESLEDRTPVICFTFREDEDVRKEVLKHHNASYISKLSDKALELLVTQLKKHIR